MTRGDGDSAREKDKERGKDLSDPQRKGRLSAVKAYSWGGCCRGATRAPYFSC